MSSVRRMLVGPRALAGVLGLAIMSGCGEDETFLARYGDGEVFTVDDYRAELAYFLEDGQTLAEMELTPETFLERAVRFRILQIEAIERVPTLAPNDQARLALFQESVLHEMLLEQLYPEPPAFSEADIMKRYEVRAWPEHHILHFQTRSKPLADEVIAAVEGGEGFPTAASRVAGQNPLDANYVDLAFLRPDQIPPQWEDVAFPLAPGEVSDVLSTGQGHHVFACVETRRTPYAELRPAIVEDLETEARERRFEDLEGELLSAARFRPDSATVALVATRFAAHRDSLQREGVETRSLAIPRFTDAERGRTFFEVAGTPFTVQALLAELTAVPGQPIERGNELERFHRLARRRALSDVVIRVADQRGLTQNPAFQERVDRKRRELHMNTLLRELWRGLGPTEEEVREQILARGEDLPGADGLRVVTFQLQRKRQANRLDEYLDQLVVKYEVEFFPERLPEVDLS